MAVATEEYKDRLFCFIFGSPEHKDWTLSLYNAVNGTSYTDPEMITIATLTQVLYMGMKDDVALLISDELDLYEHQSSFNPNMPLRLMQYCSNIYETLITMRKQNKYSSKLIPLPVPKLVTFYNGQTDQPEEKILRLSDSFPEATRAESDIEVRVRMININPGRNMEMVAKCKPLQEYTWTVASIRENRKQMDIERAIDKALDDMPGDFEIKPYLDANRKGVKTMLLTEYNEAETMEMFKEEGRAEGRAEGREEGREEGIEIGVERGIKQGVERGIILALVDLVKDKVITIKEAAKRSNLTEREFAERTGLPFAK